jgi:F0F1-type ATP synthase epsilon subunit
MNQKIKIKINSPSKIIWEGEGDYVSSVNSQGPFDILPLHANFITIIENHPIMVKVDREIKKFDFKRAIIFTSSNQVRIFTEI